MRVTTKRWLLMLAALTAACTAESTEPALADKRVKLLPDDPAQALSGDVIASGVGTPTIDGIFTPGEWSGAGSLSFVANTPRGGTTPAAWYVLNDATNLYIAVRFARSVVDPGNSAVIEFDNDADGTMESGNDAIVCSPASSPALSDNFRNATGFGPTDVSDGGTNDGVCSFANDGAYSTYEMVHPLDSPDDAHDISAATGGVVGAQLDLRMIGIGGVFPIDFGDTFSPGGGAFTYALVRLATPATCPGCIAGPVTYTRQDGAVKTEDLRFAADPADHHTLEIVDNGVRGARESITLNGVALVMPARVGGIRTLRIPVTLRAINRLLIRQSGERGTALTVTVYRDVVD